MDYFGSGSSSGPRSSAFAAPVRGQVWSSEVVVRDSSSRSRFGSNGFKFAYVLAAMVQHDFALQLWQLGLPKTKEQSAASIAAGIETAYLTSPTKRPGVTRSNL